MIINSGADLLPVGSLIRFVFDHAAAVTATESLASGDDVRVVFFDGTDNTEIPRRSDVGFNSVDTDLFFKLVEELAPGEISTDYWIYSNNQAIEAPEADPFPLLDNVAIDNSDGVSLGCAPKAAGFLSIQLRQVADTEYEVRNREHTSDTNSFGRITITDDGSGNELFSASFGDIGGTCCNPVVNGFQELPVTITSSNFTVKLESGEFSNSTRFFGCLAFQTSNPDLQGSTTRSYTVVPAAARIPASVCSQE